MVVNSGALPRGALALVIALLLIVPGLSHQFAAGMNPAAGATLASQAAATSTPEADPLTLASGVGSGAADGPEEGSAQQVGALALMDRQGPYVVEALVTAPSALQGAAVRATVVDLRL